MPEYTLESAPDSLSRDTSVCRFSSGLPPFGAQFKLPVRSFHEELSEEEDDDDDGDEAAAAAAAAAAAEKDGQPYRRKDHQEKIRDRFSRRWGGAEESWVIEDGSGDLAYSGTVQRAQKAQYVVFAVQKDTKKITVMPVKQWYQFKKQVSRRQQQRRDGQMATAMQTERAHAKSAPRVAREGQGGNADGAVGGDKGGILAKLERAGRRSAPKVADEHALEDDDDGEQENAKDGEGLDFDDVHSDDNEDEQLKGLGKQESASEGEGAAAAAGGDGKAPSKAGKKYTEEQDHGSDSFSDFDEIPSGSDGEQLRDLKHFFDQNGSASPSGSGSGSGSGSDFDADSGLSDQEPRTSEAALTGTKNESVPSSGEPIDLTGSGMAHAASTPGTAPGRASPVNATAQAGTTCAAVKPTQKLSLKARSASPVAAAAAPKGKLTLKRPREAEPDSSAAAPSGGNKKPKAAAQSDAKLELTEASIVAWIRANPTDMKGFLAALRVSTAVRPKQSLLYDLSRTVHSQSMVMVWW